MEIKDIRTELGKLTRLVDGWNSIDDVPSVERDLALEKLRSLYDAVHFAGVADTRPEVAESVTADNIEIDELLFAEIESTPHAESASHDEPVPSVPAGEPELQPFVTAGPESGATVSEPAVPTGAATLFGPEEVSRHRHKQRVIMSLYGSEELEIPAEPAVSAAVDSKSVFSAPEPAVVSVRQSEAEVVVEFEIEADESLAGEVAAAEDEPIPAPQSIPESDFSVEELPVASEPSPIGTVLGEVMNHDMRTLADTIAPPRDMASELRRSEPVGDLRRAMGLNDRFLLVRDLFGGDMEACDAALDALNGFDNLDDCMIHIAEHYVWNPHSDGAKLMMELLDRKYA